MPTSRLVALGCAVFLATTCATPEHPELGVIYSRAAQDHRRNPVVVIPGILGSRLRATDGTLVWGAFGGGAADIGEPEGARLFAHPTGDGELETLRDEVRPDGALDRLEVSFFGLPIVLDAYRAILGALGVGGYRDELLGRNAIDYGDEHFTCFQFDYDWRRSVDENARALDAFLREKRTYVERESAARFGPLTEPVRFDLVAHSMGGLVARWYLRYGAELARPDLGQPTWAGAELVERTILVGTPNSGSVSALNNLVDGVDFGLFLPFVPPAVIGTLPSVYQLLPRARHAPLTTGDGEVVPDLLDLELWLENGWGLAASSDTEGFGWLFPEATDAEARRAAARAHLRKCLTKARLVQDALDQKAAPPEGVELFLLAGDAESTPASLRWHTDRGELRYQTSAPGDGTVLRSSALGDERVAGAWSPVLRSPIRWSGVTFLFRDHLGLTDDPAFTDNVLYLLLEDPRD